ncbi:hypothetical protein KC19_2G134200 [Ceratodon purpureus]|uniref:Protein kinase domain-containing protein n=1 Tax=Ceratodon purpureus TaxID=3225 RepID=A0A8T0ITH1_CERPU|nr:hypothetical protein KC19_2G134200 [Ceratodon purpureus]
MDRGRRCGGGGWCGFRGGSGGVFGGQGEQSLSQCAQRCARHACSPLANDNFTCVAATGPVPGCNNSCGGIQLDFGGSGFVRLPPYFRNFSNSNLSPEIKRSICSYSSLQFATSGSNDNRTVENIAFGTAEGVFRAYPGRAANPDGDCINYDPRKQPGYILSTSVVKDLVVLLDSGQQDNATFESAKNVVIELLDTFTTADYVNVVTIDAMRATLLQPTSVLARNSADLHFSFGIPSLVNTPSGISNMSLGFQKAMSTFNSTSKLKIIVVITDGYFSTAGNLSNTAFQQTVSRLNSEGVVVFFFNLGPGDGENPSNPLTELRKFSCRLNSTVTYVSTEDAVRNPLWAIRPYFDYQATMRFKENVTFWTDIHADGNGQGNVSTVSYPVFKNGTLYGVASIDVPVNYTDENIIKQKYVDPNVLAIRLSCQMQQVKLNQCTKLVDPGLRPLCEQNIYIDESPASSFNKTLCCDSCAFTSTKANGFLANKANRLRLGLGAVGIFVLLFLCIVAILAYKCIIARSPVHRMKENFAKASSSTYLYSYKELKAATRNFRDDNKLGEGGIGEVYLGRNKDGSLVAVKKLTKSTKQEKREFLADVINLSKVQHKNLVKLRGFCVERKHRLLVYEFLEKKSLRQTLLGRTDDSEHVDWPTRFKIATDTARGLQYLHNESQPQIIHGDIKASNILLDSNLNAKISDFGLVKLCPDDKTNFTTNLAGTMGYMAPEFIMRGQLSEKVDVFSYGVLLMEIVTGKITTSRSRSGTMYFLLDEIRGAYLRSCEASDEDLLLRLVDARLIGRFDKDEVARVLKVALLCTSDRPSIRPSISEVILMLTGSQEIPEHLLQDFVTRGDHSRRMSIQSSPDLSNIQWWEDDGLDPPLLVERPPKRTGPVSIPTN